jgi:hypothetical protein
VQDSCPFVIGGAVPETDEAFRVCTIESLRTDKQYAGKRFTLYRGATYEAPINGMYSFTPCRRADGENARFPRPAISLPACHVLREYVNPRSTQTPKVRDLMGVSKQWEYLRQQVIAAGCLLGVSFSTPNFDHNPTDRAISI